MSANPRPIPPPARTPPGGAPDGLLAVDKPAGPTSHDVVREVRRRLGAPGAGHLGTLDPAATGLLLVAIGAATRCIPVWQGGDKTYEGSVRFGVTTTTQDLAGEVLETRTPALTEGAIREASRAFVGAIEQVPPMVSALKHRGERLHEIARRGGSVERAPRPVRILSWEWLGFELPEARFRVVCSPGTYVRTLAHDLGARLGCGAALASLRRLRSEPFGIERAVSWEELRGASPGSAWRAGGIPLEEALGHLPAALLTASEAAAVGHGRAPRVATTRLPHPVPAGRIVLRDPGGRAIALGEVVVAPGGPAEAELRPRVVLPWAVAGPPPERGR